MFEKKNNNIRYLNSVEEKSTGATYTPAALAEFVANQMLKFAPNISGELHIFDPAVGDGELLLAILKKVNTRNKNVTVFGLDTNSAALEIAHKRIEEQFPNVKIMLKLGDFLQFIYLKFHSKAENFNNNLFDDFPNYFNFVIANPPYVRTQILGKQYSNQISKQFGLDGKIDLAYAFIIGILKLISPFSTLGLIVSNRFMTVKAGATIRENMRKWLDLRSIYDLGDTKIFDASVLPAVIIANGKNKEKPLNKPIPFKTIYSTNKSNKSYFLPDPLSALDKEGIVRVPDGRFFEVRHGVLKENSTLTDIWTLSNIDSINWFATVEKNTWNHFRRIGKVRVGVKTCADSIFIRNDWASLSNEERPELLRPLITHHIANRYKAKESENTFKIIYPYESIDGKKRTVDLFLYPKAKKYFEKHKNKLINRKYVIAACREWYEIWVPHDPSAWSKPKMVFRDISLKPTFWIDVSGSIVNGDCYWLMSDNPTEVDILWLAVAVANSTFIAEYYDKKFGNKLFSGRRRFITQYVEKFPLPDPNKTLSKTIVEKAKRIYNCENSIEKQTIENEIDVLVWEAFGFDTSRTARTQVWGQTLNLRT